MKNIFESSETFVAYARIDYCMMMLEKLKVELGRNYIPIEIAANNAAQFRKDDIKMSALEYIRLLKDIIECKKFIEADYSSEEATLASLEELRKTFQ